MRTLLLEFWTEKNDFCIYAESDDFEKEITLARQAKTILTHFHNIYEILEEKKPSKHKELEEALDWLSKQILSPFSDQLRECQLVRILPEKNLIRCAFDLLSFDGEFLFMQRRVCYQIVEGAGEDEPAIELGSALLIADRSADPEEACLWVSKHIPNSTYAKMENADLQLIKEAADQVDIVVISAHGSLEEDNSGEISINNETIRAKLVGKLEAWLVYFDSCSQGANLSFLQAFQEESDVQFYLAPIVSNDAGDSSTRTLQWFFTDVLAHQDPIRGLFETRKQLYNYYYKQKKLNLITSLNKAFVFRLYEFVEESQT